MANAIPETGVIPTSELVHESGEYVCIYPQRYADLKRQIVKKEDEEAVIKAWNEILVELENLTEEFTQKGSAVIPEIDYSDIHKLSEEKIIEIKRRGCVVIRNIIDDAQVLRWKEQLREYVNINPADNKQFFEVYWSKPQLQARSHPHVLDTTKWLNSLWRTSGRAEYPVSLSTQVTLTDRFRIRLPTNEVWTRLNPHVDGGSVERWEDENYRSSFEEIFKGSWKSHDPFDIDRRLAAKTNLYTHQADYFKAWQGWLAMSDTGPNEGTLQVFPDLQVGISYLMLRPFFREVDPASPKPLDPSNWVLDLSNPDLPGIAAKGKGFGPIRLTKESHPHMRIPEALVSIPKIAPGDFFFWHSDIAHAVEAEHHGKNDSSVMYIAAVPLTLQNIKYVVRQRDLFYKGLPGPSFAPGVGEANFIDKGEVDDIHDAEGRRAMGLEKFDGSVEDTLGAKEVIKLANKLIEGTV